MKPLFISTLYHPNMVGGAEKIAQIVVESMRDAGHRPVVVTCDERPGVRADFVNGVKVYYIGLKNIYWPYSRKSPSALLKPLWHAVDRYNPWMASALDGILQQEKPDVVNTHSLTGLSCAVWPSIKRHGLPIYHTLHDYSLMCPKAAMFKRDQNCVRQCHLCKAYTLPSKDHSAQVDGVIGVSRYTLDRHLAAGYFPNAKTRKVIHNALPAHPHGVSMARTPNGPLRIGYVGRLVRNKGIEQLLVAMREWPASVCHLVVAGRGLVRYERELREQATANVEFLGFVDPTHVYRRIDVLVVPSLWEDPLPTVVIEAYFHGIPVIVSDRGGLPELVEQGKTGIVYSSANPAALKEAITTFLHQPALIQQLKPWVQKKAEYFRLDRLKSEYRNLLEQASHGASVESV